MRLEELLRVAELHVAEATGLPVSSGGLLTARAVTPREWALRTLEDWKPLLEKLAGTMTATLARRGSGPEGPGAGQEGGAASGAGRVAALDSGPRGPAAPAGGGGPGGAGFDPMAQLFGNLPQVLGPFLFGMQAGSMVGQLAFRALGQYDLPMPRPARDELMLVPATIDAFASDWSLPADDVRLWVCLRETTNNAVLGRPHVRARLDQLIADYVGAFRPNPNALEERLERLRSHRPDRRCRRPSAIPRPCSASCKTTSSAASRCRSGLCWPRSSGYVDHIMDTVGRRLIGAYGPLTEALRRRRLEETGGTRILGQLFGVALDEAGYERGQAFVRGIVERAGEEGLARLWRSARELPTPGRARRAGSVAGPDRPARRVRRQGPAVSGMRVRFPAA